MATIYDVARLAGVSPATVSRVFNGVGVSEEKVVAVRQAAAQLKFFPNRTARTLRRQSSEVIALVIPDIENPYFTEMARGVEDVASEAGYSVVLCNSDAQQEKEAAYLRIAIAEHMSGVILAAASDHTNLDEILATGRPVVAVDRSTGHDVDGVVMANRDAGRLATAHMLKTHRRVAYIGGPENIETSADRADGWRRAHRDAGLEPPVDLLRSRGVRLAVATDCNPGTSPLLNPQLAMNLACTLFGLSPEEALAGMTVNAAAALGLDTEIGTIEPGKAADLCAWPISEPAELGYWIGMPGPLRRIVAGRDAPVDPRV